jgi:predicted esterase
MRTDANLKTPFFQAHGTDDMVVNFKFGEMTYNAMKKMGIDVEFHKIEDMGHEAQDDELRLLGKWLKDRPVVREVEKEPAKTTETETETKGSKGKV